MKTNSDENFSDRLNAACDMARLPGGHGRITRLREACAKAGIRVSVEAVRKWLTEGSIPRMSNATRLAELLHVSVDWLLNGGKSVTDVLSTYQLMLGQLAPEVRCGEITEEEMISAAAISATSTGRRSASEHTEPGPSVGPYKGVPIVGTAQMGDDGYWMELDYPVGHGDGYIDAPTRDANAYALRVRGQSMAPAIRDGWIVVIEPNRDPVPGEYVMVKTTDGRSMVKELLYARPDVVSLMSVNDGYGRLNLAPDEIEKMHPVGMIVPPSKIRL
ncbi:MAG: S24 family peptidase [Halothiobacillaceae bacterium]